MKKSLGAKPFALPAPVWTVGAYDLDGKPNAMIAAWGGICCSDPASVCVAIRESRHTYPGIIERGAFTVSVCSQDQAEQADYLGIASGKDVDKFAKTGLTPVRGEFVDAPYVQEFPAVIECELTEKVNLGMHMLLVGKIRDVKVDDDKLLDGKFPDIEKIRPLVFTPGARTYHGVGELAGKAFECGLKYK
ncbi:flavin reductase family protein [Desulfovibrio oxyclinae]|uniref:flavin reductase family protein n=1 Tax=Desulfovibrio oxyclinae TaxID=63560 RepID=UPI0003689FA3|nr:flavin reductase family protein [Desulfovibrio oxyclinae]